MNINEKNYKLGDSASAIRTLYEYGKQRKAKIGENNVYDFSIGNPSAAVPESFVSILKELLEKDGVHGYTSNAGDFDVRNNIAKYLNEKYDADVNGNLVFMTCGAAASIAIALNALVADKDDEIIIFAPFFPEYKVFIEHSGAKTVVVLPDIPNFEINFDDLEKKINKNTKAVIIDSPNNPTGKIIEENTLIKLTKLLKEKENEYGHPIYLIYDEPYREIIYDDIKYPFVTNYYDDSLVCYSYSKALSLPGERIGYLLVNPKCNEAINVFKAASGAARALGYICAPSLFQYAIAKSQWIKADINEYKENRNVLCNILDECGFEYVNPQGAFYLFVKCPINDANKFSKQAMKHELLVVPSDSFGIDGYVRVSYCVKKEVIIKAKNAFIALANDYK